MRVGVIFSMQPDYGSAEPLSHRAFWAGQLRNNSPLAGKVYPDQWPGSFEAGNVMLAAALNGQESGIDVTHVVMLHNDVVPETGWLDILVEEMARTGADILSAVIPIKDMLGLSSCAIDSPDNPFEVERRITMTEIFTLPETFGSEDCGYGPGKLLVNTGCIMMDFTKDWRKLENPDGSLKLVFDRSSDRVKRRADGKWESQHSPADWALSRYCNNLGLKVLATRKVRCVHMGKMPYSSEHPWGEWAVDNALKHKWNGVPLNNGEKREVSASYIPREVKLDFSPVGTPAGASLAVPEAAKLTLTSASADTIVENTVKELIDGKAG